MTKRKKLSKKNLKKTSGGIKVVPRTLRVQRAIDQLVRERRERKRG